MKFRGAHAGENQKKRLNDRAGKLLRDAGLDFGDEKNYEWIKEKGAVEEGPQNYYQMLSIIT